jgi:hypothetical protein
MWWILWHKYWLDACLLAEGESLMSNLQSLSISCKKYLQDWPRVDRTLLCKS